MAKRCNLCTGQGMVEEEACPLCQGSGQFIEGCGSCHHFCFSPLSYQKSGGGSGYCTLSIRRLVPGWPRKKGEWETMSKAIVRVDHRCKDYKETQREDATFGSWWRKEWPTLR